jgi:hypothetical protein
VQSSELFPTEFAKKLCVGVKLYDESLLATGRTKKDSAYALQISLQEFQQLAIADQTFEDCLNAYFGKTINKKQKEVLELIHKLTKPFLLGHISGVLTEAMEKSTSRNFLEAAQLLVGADGMLRDSEEKQNGNVFLYFDGQDSQA